MENKALKKAIKKSVKIFKKYGYSVTSKNITESSHFVEMRISAERQKRSE